MAKAALMVEETEELEELEVPTGGIGDFVMDEDEAEKVYGDDSEVDAEDAKEEFGDSGIAQFPALAERMAKYGRNEDNMLAHVAEGELVIPSQFLEDEVIKQRIYDILTEAGVEDPEAYVVGAESNDLNPTTGLPEFFLKKLFKGIVKGIKKVVKGVIKVIKKIAPIVLPIVLAMTPLGPIFGAALGSGIGTLLNGGSIKDALKSALISGAIGGISAGFGAGGGQGSFMENVSEAASGFGARVGQTASGFTEGISSGSFGGFKDSFFADYVPTPGAEVDKAANAFKLSEAGVEIVDPTVVQNAGGSQYIVKQGDTLSEIAQANNTTVDAIAKASNIDPANINNIQIGQELTLSGSTQAGADASRSFLEKTGDVMFRGGKTPEAIAGVQDAAGKEYLTKMAASGIAPTEAGLKAAQAAAGPGLLTRFGPSALAGTAVAAGAGFFDVPEMEQATFLDYNSDGTLVTGRDLIDADPGKYLVKNLGQIQLNEETGEYEPITTDLAIMGEDTVGYVPPEQVAVMPRIDPQQYLTSSTPGGPFARPYVTQGYQSAAEGGPIFPRRNGGIAPNEGTPGEDSVRAMLMPGEFVMTTDAVRGLGNGNLNNGIKNMYSVMRNLESRGRQMA
jgi:LysM repeat protein